MYLSKENNISDQLQHQELCSPVSIELVFEWNTSCKHNFLNVDRLILFQIGQPSYVEETHVFLERKPSMVEAGATSTLFSRENCVSFVKEYFLPLWWFKVEMRCVCSKYAYSLELK
jgi:hypothetical protein